MSADIKNTIRDYIQKELAPGKSFKDDESLLEGGILDSMAITRLIEFIDDKLGVEVPDEEFEPDNFETVDAICALVTKKQGSA